MAVIVGFAMLAWPLVSVADTSDDDALVASLFPGRLTVESAKFTDPPVREYCFLRGDLEKSGATNYVVALYTNGISSVLDVIKPATGGGSVVGTSEGARLGGGSGHLALRDVDGDGKPEVFASIRFNRGVETWIFAWRLGELVCIGPLETCATGRSVTALGDPIVSDIDGDGLAEIIVPSAFPDDAAEEGNIYGLSKGKYAKRTTIRFLGTYLRGKGTPAPQSATFAGIQGSSDFQVRIVNGDDFGDHRTSSAVVRLNGVILAGPDEFKPKARTLVLPLTMQSNNSLEVEMRGEPDSAVSVIIERKALPQESAKPPAPAS